MRSRRDCKTLIHLLYFVIRAWLALTTPCVAETSDSLGSGSTEIRGRLDDAILSDKSNWATTDDPKRIYLQMSICHIAARLQLGVARRGTLT
jgi:hypothetical protein